MASAGIELRLSEEFRQEARRFGFAGDVRLVIPPLQAQLRRSPALPPRDSSGRIWIQWTGGVVGRNLGRNLLWFGGRLDAGALTLDRIRVEEQA